MRRTNCIYFFFFILEGQPRPNREPGRAGFGPRGIGTIRPHQRRRRREFEARRRPARLPALAH